MPAYSFMIDKVLDTSTTPTKIRVMQKLGVPYPAGYDKIANKDLVIQANEIASDLKRNSVAVKADKEIIAIIAYLQRMGTDITKNQTTAENK